MNSLEKLFAKKLTENGDDAFNTTGDNLLDLLFMSEYYSKHLDEVEIDKGEIEVLFSMFMRDPRFGLGRRDLGRELLKQSGAMMDEVVKCGRYDDLFVTHASRFKDVAEYVYNRAVAGDELAKKWLPRFNTKHDELAKNICKVLGISQKKYRKSIKANTVEHQMSDKDFDNINYEHVPSLAMIKYYNRFMKEERFKEYIESVKKGEKKLNVSTTTVYDIYRNRDKIDADLFFDKLEKISISCIPILDTSGSMWDENDSIGKATSIAYYLAKNSTYCNNHVVSFSSHPTLIKIKEQDYCIGESWGGTKYRFDSKFGSSNKFSRELNSMYTGDCSNTDFGKVITLLGQLDEFPDYFVVLSDMEFDCGSNMSKEKVMQKFKANDVDTKIIWWNFSARATTTPELDEYGNIFLSGYNPMLLKYLESGFDGKKFLSKLLEEYAKNIKKIIV